MKLKKKLLLNKYLKKRKTYIVTSISNLKKTVMYKKKGYKIIFINQLKKKIDFILLFKKIYKKKYSRVLIESGLTFLNTLLKNNLLNDLYIFKSNEKLGKNGKNNDTSKYLKKISPKLITINLNGDNLFKKEF